MKQLQPMLNVSKPGRLAFSSQIPDRTMRPQQPFRRFGNRFQAHVAEDPDAVEALESISESAYDQFVNLLEPHGPGLDSEEADYDDLQEALEARASLDEDEESLQSAQAPDEETLEVEN